MSEIVFSTKQREVIETRNKNILVSAAAGSGKTAVLVQRIIEKVLDGKENINIDEILVLTYTEAAAGEMRERIEAAINARLQENPEDERIAKQAVLVHNAQISTIHGFCLALIKNNFAEIMLDPTFRVPETGEIKLIEGQVLEELLEELFEGDLVDDFEILADRFVNKNNLDNLKETILSAYSVCRNNPFVEDYIEERRLDYALEDGQDILDTSWGQALRGYTNQMLDEAVRLAEYNIDYAMTGPYMYKEAFEHDLEVVKRLRECENYSDYYNALGNVSFDRLSSKKDSSVSEESKEYAKAIRQNIKDIINKLAKDYFAESASNVAVAMKANAKVVNVLVDVLLLYNQRLEEEKRRRKVIDFSDMEHYALRILLEKNGNIYAPTQVARDYRGAFKEIMVDEYQDSNHVQESILKAISGEEDGVFNRFMVGDVKQSIYSFRNACPELFMGKYSEYGLDGNKSIRIDLSTNYRSRFEVLNSVNYVFERLMGQDLGGIDYSDDARLNLGANYPEVDADYTTELMLLEYEDEIDEKKQELEAKMVALKINEMVNSDKPFVVNSKEGTKACEYKDIVILLRSNKGWDDVFKRVLEQYGIPAYVTSKTGYFSTTEIRQLLNLLQVLDNPRSEIELFGVLNGCFGNFTNEELALIRAYSKNELYDAIKDIANKEFESIENIDEETVNKCVRFMAFLNKYRQKVVYTPINELLEELISDTGYLYHIASMPFGEQRRANVYMLIEKAKQYENGSFKGLYHFVRYINEIQSYEVDYGEAITMDEQSNVVRIMSIHKSKGLEFPVCFLCGTAKGFNFRDCQAEVIYDRNYGVAFDYLDTEKNVKYPDLRHEFLGRSKKESVIAEEMRVLYVAMTRAKEKLIITACAKNMAKSIENSQNMRDLSVGKVLPYFVRSKCGSYLDFILNTIDTDKGDVIRTTLIDGTFLDEQNIITGVTKSGRKEKIIVDIDKSVNNKGLDSSVGKNMENKIMFKYLHENLSNLYTKTSVSELKMAAMQEKLIASELEETASKMFEIHEGEAYIPNFISKDEKISGTTRGTAYHRVMELFFLENTEDFACLDRNSQIQNVTSVIKMSINNGKINQDEADLVDVEKVIAFLNTDLAKDMWSARKRGDLHLEEPFVLGVSADRLNKDFPEEEMVLIQGIIDVFYIENGKIVLMDYKTDNVSKEDELIKRYKVQLDYYKEALERITGLEVAKQLIYSFAFGQVLEV